MTKKLIDFQMNVNDILWHIEQISKCLTSTEQEQEAVKKITEEQKNYEKKSSGYKLLEALKTYVQDA